MASTRQKFSTTQIRKLTSQIEEAVRKLKRENKGEHFTAVTAEEVQKKLRRLNSPMIISQGWSSTTPGGSFNYSLGIFNPDPIQVGSLFAHVFVGSGNVDPVSGTFLLNVDDRFARLTEPPFFGLSLAPGASATLNFTLTVPPTAPRTQYLGNSCLMQFNWHDIGTYLDRSVFVFGVS
ncbi:MAG TPA: hypothetical protein VLL05_07240 [Terriglobales bacterium]|nr:hypothetical protein [Terriglobales bacterium]